MGLRSYDQSFKEKVRQTFTIPVKSGDYASERITFGVCPVGMQEQSFREISALVESPFVTGAVVELWLPRLADGGEAASARTDADYTNSGVTPQSVVGLARWQVSGYPGAQIRVKSGGTPGVLAISATGF